eukprot:364326-Chlamydomonas_euryale.AAC.9
MEMHLVSDVQLSCWPETKCSRAMTRIHTWSGRVAIADATNLCRFATQPHHTISGLGAQLSPSHSSWSVIPEMAILHRYSQLPAEHAACELCMITKVFLASSGKYEMLKMLCTCMRMGCYAHVSINYEGCVRQGMLSVIIHNQQSACNKRRAQFIMTRKWQAVQLSVEHWPAWISKNAAMCISIILESDQALETCLSSSPGRMNC